MLARHWIDRLIVVFLTSFFFGAPGWAAIEIVHEFTDPPTLINSLVEGADGVLYGVGDGGEPVTVANPNFTGGNRGLLFRMTLAGTVTALHRFSPADGAGPFKLIRGQDGVIYGLTHGIADPGRTNSKVAPTTLFRVTAEGAVETLSTFTDAGWNEIAAAADGTVYGSRAGSGGGSQLPDTSDTIFKRTPDGTVSALATVANGLSSLTLDAEGNLRGTCSTYQIIFGVNRVVRSELVKITPDGVVSSVYSTAQSWFAGQGAQWVGAVDGKFYGIRGTYDGQHVSPESLEVFRVTAAGSFKVLTSFGGRRDKKEAARPSPR